MKTLLVVTAVAALACDLASAQKLTMDFSALAAKATTKNEITLDSGALDMAQKAASLAKKDDQDKAGDLGKILSGIQGVVVRDYKFAKAGEYSDKDLEPLRRQVGSGSGWSRIISTRDKDENTEIYLYNQGGQASAMLVIAAKEKELTVVHISGAVQLAQLKDLVDSAIHYDVAALNAADAR